MIDTTYSYACRIIHLISTKEVRVLPRIRAPKESPTFVNIFIANIKNCLFSNRLFDSSANEDIVVKDPQKPTAKRSEYFASRFHITDMTEKIPNARLPTTFTIKMLMGSNPIEMGEETILYLRKAPASAPTPNNRNSIPFIFLSPILSIPDDRHYQHS
ncbi:MAG: hypothetical protein WA421_09785 [Nitrososphaeraceae archaeon]